MQMNSPIASNVSLDRAPTASETQLKIFTENKSSRAFFQRTVELSVTLIFI